MSRKKQVKYYGDPKNKIIGVTLGWSLIPIPQLCFEGGLVNLHRIHDKLIYPEYFEEDKEWPIDPITKEKLPVVDL